MSAETVSEIVLGQRDNTGRPIITIYSKISRIYAVYATDERIMVHYADDERLASEQRLALAHLAPLRGEINSLIDGWRSANGSGRLGRKAGDGGGEAAPRKTSRAVLVSESRTRRFDRRTADALMVALQGDQASAGVLLGAIKQDILDERTSTGRVQYVLSAWIFALVIFALLGTIHASGAPAFIASNNVWEISSLGCLGALFSIAIGIRGRFIQTDLRLRDNLIDAGLRILIGAISAVILYALFRSEIISLAIGGKPITMCGAADCGLPAISVVIAFLAGFSERLVGNLLETRILPSFAEAESNLRQSPPSSSAAIAEARNQPNEINPLGRQEPAASVASVVAAEDDGDDAVDHCLCDVDTDDDPTDDVDLPQAIGGVERVS